METYNTTEIINILSKKNISVFSAIDFARLFKVDRRDTVYKKLDRLRKNGIIARSIKGKYFFTLNPPDDFTLANFLYQPSYISLESALSFHGIITGFPYAITSVTPRKTKKYLISGKQKEYEYTHLAPKLFWGYEKKEPFLMANPEKAIFDYLYLAFKGLRPAAIDEFDLSTIDRIILKDYLRKMPDQRFLRFTQKLKLL
jgi:predicted transcriptional regulator of viral defense system